MNNPFGLDEVKRQRVPDDQRPIRCENCPYQRLRTCGSRGPEDAPIVMVAESPGDLEEKYGLPLIGPSGKLIESALPPPNSPSRPPILYLNAIQCFPGPSGKKNPNTLTNAVFSCRTRLFEELRKHPRDLIIVLGKYAAISITGDSRISITKISGQTRHLTYNGVPLAQNGVFFSVHPSFLLHGGGNANVFYKDIKRAIHLGTSITGGEGGSDSVGRKIKPLKVIQHTHIRAWLNSLSTYPTISADIETTGFNHLEDRVLWLGGYGGDDSCHVISGEDLERSIDSSLKDGEFLKVPDEYPPRFIWQNGKFDVKFLRHLGLDLPIDYDTMLMSYVLNEQAGNHDLDAIALHYVGVEPHKDMVSEYYRKGRTLADAPEELVLDYLSRDLRSTFLVYHEMRPLIDEDVAPSGVWSKPFELEPPNKKLEDRLYYAGDMLSTVEEKGMLVDMEVLGKNNISLANKVTTLQHDILEMTCGQVDNPASTYQVKHYLYQVLGMPPISDSTDRATLERLLEMKGESEFISALLEYRRASKLWGTYVRNIPGMLDAGGRIHPTFLLHGTITGRLASRGPNMQNIPREGAIRNQFRAPPGKALMGIDLNQAELRVLACISGDEHLIEIYNDPAGESLHNVVARRLFGDGTPEFKIHPEMKMKAKTVNFGIVYGRTGKDIAREYGLPKHEGDDWLYWWFENFPQAKKFLDRCKEAPLKEETLLSPFGNRKRPKVVSHATKHNIQNQYMNFLPQSIASQLVMDTCALMFDRHSRNWSTKHKGWEICNLIHDESLFEIEDRPQLQQEVFKEFHETCEEIAWDHGFKQVPFICEAKVGTHWGSLTEQDWKCDLIHTYGGSQQS